MSRMWTTEPIIMYWRKMDISIGAQWSFVSNAKFESLNTDAHMLINSQSLALCNVPTNLLCLGVNSENASSSSECMWCCASCSDCSALSESFNAPSFSSSSELSDSKCASCCGCKSKENHTGNVLNSCSNVDPVKTYEKDLQTPPPTHTQQAMI